MDDRIHGVLVALRKSNSQVSLVGTRDTNGKATTANRNQARAGFDHVGIDVTPERSHLYAKRALLRIQQHAFHERHVQHHATGVQAISGCAMSSTSTVSLSPSFCANATR